jgi:hypothetical protein
MFKRLIVVAATAATLVLASGTTAIATASPGTSVDFGDCANSPDAATVPAGSPITLTDTGSSATGNYGTALHGYKSGVNTVTIAVTGGTTTTFELASAPPRFYGDPYYAWLNVLPDIQLDPLAPGGSVLVTIDYTNTTGGEVVFPRQGNNHPHFGPFHFGPGDTFEAQCLITAG